VLQAPKVNCAVSTHWCFEPPLLLALPFGAFAIASVTATSSLSAMRFVGTALLAVLCSLSIAYGIKRTPRQFDLKDPNAKSAVETPAAGTAGAAQRENTGNGQSMLLDREQLAIPVLLRTPTYDAQPEIAAVLGAIAIVALGVVTFLVAGQIQRSGRITPFGLVLGGLLILVPAGLALHLLLSRIEVEFTPQCVRVIRKRGLFGATVTRWNMTELQVVRLDAPTIGSTLYLVVRSQNQQRTILLRGTSVKEARQWLELGCGKS
jgi:hypothetical protein